MNKNVPALCALVASLGFSCTTNDSSPTISEALEILRKSRPEYRFSVNGNVDGIPFTVTKTGDKRIDISAHDPARYRAGDNKSGASLIAYINGPDFGDGDDYFGPIHEPVRDGRNYSYTDRAEILKYLQTAVRELR